MSTLERAIGIAAHAHAGQLDQAGEPYILHPIRVMLALEDRNAQIVAVLHDVVEDSPLWSLGHLAGEGFSGEIIRAVKALTRSRDMSYSDYLAAIKQNPLACEVKLADIADNMNPERLEKVPDAAPRLRAKYEAALQFLRAAAGTDREGG